MLVERCLHFNTSTMISSMVIMRCGLFGIKCINYYKAMHLELNSYICCHYKSYIYPVHNISLCYHVESLNLFHMSI
jgi:hypothetical protein